MMKDVMDQVQKQKDLNYPMHYYHRIGVKEGEYMAELAELANIKPVPPVLGKLYTYHYTVGKNRTAIYRLLNDEEFIMLEK